MHTSGIGQYVVAEGVTVTVCEVGAHGCTIKSVMYISGSPR